MIGIEDLIPGYDKRNTITVTTYAEAEAALAKQVKSQAYVDQVDKEVKDLITKLEQRSVAQKQASQAIVAEAGQALTTWAIKEAEKADTSSVTLTTATLTVADSKIEASVYDNDALLKWARAENRQDELFETTYVPKVSAISKLLSDRPEGDTTVPPGVSYVYTDKHIEVT